MHCSHVPTGRPRFKVSHMRVPIFRGGALCQILAITCVTVEFCRFNLLNEGADVGALGGFPCISVSPLYRIAEERRVTHL